MSLERIVCLIVALGALLAMVWGVCTFVADYVDDKGSHPWAKYSNKLRTIAFRSALVGFLLFGFAIVFSIFIFVASGRV